VPSPAASPAPLPGDVFLVLSDQIARDYALSPDAARVAFLVPGLVQGQFVSRTYVADIKSKDVTALPSPAGITLGDQLSPVSPGRQKVAMLLAVAEPGRFCRPPGSSKPCSPSPVSSTAAELVAGRGPRRPLFLGSPSPTPAQRGSCSYR
jgi:hypothetical protein